MALRDMVNDARSRRAAAERADLAFNSNLKIDQERRRNSIILDNDVVGTEHVLKGRTQLQGAGEATINLSFPVTYIEPPTFTFGYELDLGTTLEPGQFPIVSCGVSAWGPNGEGPIMPDAEEGQNWSLRTWYTGAVVACVATGPAAQNIHIHWMFTGVAITAPITDSLLAGTIGGTI